MLSVSTNCCNSPWGSPSCRCERLVFRSYGCYHTCTAGPLAKSNSNLFSNQLYYDDKPNQSYIQQQFTNTQKYLFPQVAHLTFCLRWWLKDNAPPFPNLRCFIIARSFLLNSQPYWNDTDVEIEDEHHDWFLKPHIATLDLEHIITLVPSWTTGFLDKW